MHLVHLASVWLHILAAATWLGTMMFLVVVLVPTLRATGDDALRARLLAASGARLRALGWVAFAVLLGTGMVNLVARGFDLTDPSDLTWRLWVGPFGRTFLVKMSAFLVVVVLSAIHDFRIGPRATTLPPGSPAALRLRRAATWIGRVNLLLALVIVFCAVVMVRGLL